MYFIVISSAFRPNMPDAAALDRMYNWNDSYFKRMKVGLRI